MNISKQYDKHAFPFSQDILPHFIVCETLCPMSFPCRKLELRSHLPATILSPSLF